MAQNNKTLRLVLGIIAIGLVVCGAIYLSSAVRERSQEEAKTTSEETKEITVTLIVEVESEGIDKTYSVNLEENSTVFEMMEKAKEKGFIFNYSESDLGVLVDEIVEIKNDSESGKYWVYYLNGEMAQVGVSEQKLQDNDQILWRFELPAF